jgi:hypothetical protein
VLFAVGQPAAAVALGAVLLAVCGLVTVTNFCIPSTLLNVWWRRRGAQQGLRAGNRIGIGSTHT